MRESYKMRLDIVERTVRHEPVACVPIVPMVSSLPFSLYGGTYKDSLYSFKTAEESIIRYFVDFQPDAIGLSGSFFSSGPANELSKIQSIDWPGRPGTKIKDECTHQALEREFMFQDEYDELIHDYYGFILKKYIPRMYPALKAFENIDFLPASVLSTRPLNSFYSRDMLDAYSVLGKIAEADRDAIQATESLYSKLDELEFPRMVCGGSQAPYDIIGDYFRGTIAMLEDCIECPEKIAEACDMFADRLIESFKKIDFSKMPVKRILFPLHKGFDSFMSPKQYATVYWPSLRKVIFALVDMGVTPFIYLEGAYDSRIDILADVPKGKVIYHFETADMVRVKKVLGDIACISGNLPISLLQYGSPQQVSDAVKRLLDICAPGGGFILDTNAFINEGKRENIEAMFDTCRTYGKY